jgi:hypothetical protein
MVATPPGQILITFFRVLGLFLLGGFLGIFFARTPDSTLAIPPQASPAIQQKPQPPASIGKDEITAHDTPTTVKVSVNIVLVRVIVRDAQGKAITNLKKEDFQLADDRKPQAISSFSVDVPGSHLTEVPVPSAEARTAAAETKTMKLPDRFVALFFDDLHLVTEDVMVARQAATKLFATLQPTDRVSIFTTSGQVEQDFTADRQNLEAALQRISPRGVSTHSATDCPPVSFYEAHRIIDDHDSLATQVAILDAIGCGVSRQAHLWSRSPRRNGSIPSGRRSCKSPSATSVHCSGGWVPCRGNALSC